jgi:hypothetical protein
LSPIETPLSTNTPFAEVAAGADPGPFHDVGEGPDAGFLADGLALDQRGRVKTARFGSLSVTHLVFPVAFEISAAQPGLNFDRHKVRIATARTKYLVISDRSHVHT